MDFQDGYEFFYKSNSGIVAAEVSNNYINEINENINKLLNDLNSFKGFNTDPKQLQGDIAEFWHADTFNIKSSVSDSNTRAYVDRSNAYSSVDVSTNWGDNYGLKYYRDAAESAKAQAKSIFERYKEYQGSDDIYKFLADRGYPDDVILNDPIYSGQMRLIPKDQFENAKDWLKRKIAKESVIRPEEVKRFQDTYDFLTTKIKDAKGNESIELSREDAQKLATLAKKGNITTKEIKDITGIDLSAKELVRFDKIMQEAFKAGLSAATISAAMKVAPEIIKAISKLIESGELDKNDFDRIGFAALSGSAEGFVRGTITASIVTSCQAGLLGEVAKNTMDSNVIAMAVVIVMDTMHHSYLVACGKMTQEELVMSFIKRTYIATVSYITGSIAQTILSEIPVLGFMIGSFIGSVIGNVTYSIGQNKVISFCIDTGFTMFGLVKQDYKLPKEVIELLGGAVLEPKKLEPKLLKPKTLTPKKLTPKKLTPKKIDVYFLRRGVIGVNIIGYVL